MSMRVPVSADWDLTLGRLTHTFWAPPPSVPPAPDKFIPSIEFPVTIKWMSSVMGSASLTETVVVSPADETVALKGHDCGILIPDVTVPPLNVWLPIAWLFSQRNMVFASSSTRFEGKYVGLSAALILNQITCADPVKLPAAAVLPMNLRHRVKVGMNWKDLLMGWAEVVFVAVVDLIFAKIGGDLKTKKFANPSLSGDKLMTQLKGDKLVRKAAAEGREAARKAAKNKSFKEMRQEANDRIRDQSRKSFASARDAKRAGRGTFDDGGVPVGKGASFWRGSDDVIMDPVTGRAHVVAESPGFVSAATIALRGKLGFSRAIVGKNLVNAAAGYGMEHARQLVYPSESRPSSSFGFGGGPVPTFSVTFGGGEGDDEGRIGGEIDAPFDMQDADAHNVGDFTSVHDADWEPVDSGATNIDPDSKTNITGTFP